MLEESPIQSEDSENDNLMKGILAIIRDPDGKERYFDGSREIQTLDAAGEDFSSEIDWERMEG